MADINETRALMGILDGIDFKFNFLTDTFFEGGAIYEENTKIDVDVRDGDNRLAPFISPMSAGKVMTRQGFRTYEVDAPWIGVKRPITFNELKKRSFGEPFNTHVDPEQRAAALRAEDFQFMDDAIARRIELMCSELMQNLEYNAECMAEDNVTKFTQNFKFYDGEAPTNVYTPANKWDSSDANILGDVRNMKKLALKSGNAGTLLVCTSATADAFLHDETVRDLLDNRSINVGALEGNDMTAGNFDSSLGVLRAPGAVVTILTYDGFYTNDKGEDVSYIPDGRVILSAPKAGRIDFGAVTQMEQGDPGWHTYGGVRVPKHLDDPVGNTESMQLVSRPLPMPKTRNAFIVADVY